MHAMRCISEEPQAQSVDALSSRLVPWMSAGAAGLSILALAIALIASTREGYGGDALRIALIHIPVAWLSIGVYLVMGVCAAASLAVQARLAALVLVALAPTGALFALLAIVTGSLPGPPDWGSAWVSDARLVCELILLGLYGAVLALHRRGRDPQAAHRASAVLVLAGLMNIPVIYLCLDWWGSPHQGQADGLAAWPAMARTMLAGMFSMVVALCLYAGAVVMSRLRCMLLEHAPSIDTKESA